MADTLGIGCRCGQVRLSVSGAPIISAECFCDSCQEGAKRMARLPGAPEVTTEAGGTPYVLYRKDRVAFVQGAELIRAFRLSPERQTQRYVASCCNTPLFVEFKGGHWLSLYAGLWGEADRPAMEIRTQTGEVRLDDALPAGRWATARFYGRLLRAWAAMRFRTPAMPAIGPELKV
jgi:hypothetical protein